jgi:hypothetical protein
MHIKQPSFESVNAKLSVADVVVELLVQEVPALRFGAAG